MYPYQANFVWKWAGQFNLSSMPDQGTLTNELVTDVQAILSGLLAKKFALAGRTFLMGNVDTTQGNYRVSGNTVYFGDITANQTVISFQLDIPGASQEVTYQAGSSDSEASLDGGTFAMLQASISDPTLGTTAQILKSGSNIPTIALGLGILGAIAVAVVLLT